jgi:hypothetical protein
VTLHTALAELVTVFSESLGHPFAGLSDAFRLTANQYRCFTDSPFRAFALSKLAGKIRYASVAGFVGLVPLASIFNFGGTRVVARRVKTVGQGP